MYSLFIRSIYCFKQAGVKGIITDLDNTLIDWNRPEATPEVAEWLKK